MLNNALSLISPLTGDLACGDNDLTGIDELLLTDAAAGATAAGRLRRNATALTWHDGTAARTVAVGTSSPTFGAVTATGLVTGAGFTGSGNVAITPAAVSGTPAQHGLFRENVVKGWILCNYAGAITASFNVSSITDNGDGDTTVTWDRDFASGAYVVVASALRVGAQRYTSLIAQLAGSVRIETDNQVGSAVDADSLHVLAIGDQ